MAGGSVHFARIPHPGVGARFQSSRKRWKKVFAQSILRDESRAAVTAGGGIAVAHIMFQRSRNAAGARKIAAFITANSGHTHHRREISILSERLPQTRPQRLPPGVEHG